MKVLIPFFAIMLIVGDLLFFRGQHLTIIAGWVKPILEGIRTGGNMWGS